MEGCPGIVLLAAALAAVSLSASAAPLEKVISMHGVGLDLPAIHADDDDNPPVPPAPDPGTAPPPPDPGTAPNPPDPPPAPDPGTAPPAPDPGTAPPAPDPGTAPPAPDPSTAPPLIRSKTLSVSN